MSGMEKLSDLLEMAKVSDIIATKKEKEDSKIVWALAIIGAIAAVAGIAFAVYKYLTPDYMDDFDEDFDDDFEQSAEEQNVDKYYQEDDVNLESVIDESTYAEIKYPCLLLNRASTNEEVDFLRSFSTEKNNSKAIYLYCEAAQGVCEIGYIKLTLKFLLTLSRMPGYRLYSLYSDTSERNEIKLDDPEVLSNFISL